MNLIGKSWQHARQVTVGTPAVIELPAFAEFTVAVAPGAAASALLETTTAPVADVRAGLAGVIWRPWGQGTAGSITAAAAEGFTTPRTAIRVTATTQPCRVELVQRADAI